MHTASSKSMGAAEPMGVDAPASKADLSCSATRVQEKSRDVVMTDFSTGLPPAASGYGAIIFCIDKLTKYVRLAPIHTTYPAEGCAELFMAHVHLYHGLPKRVRHKWSFHRQLQSGSC